MLTFLFWNLMGNQSTTWSRRAPAIQKHLTRLVVGLDVDILIVVESAFAVGDVIASCNGGGATSTYCHLPSLSRRIEIFTRLPETSVPLQLEDVADERLIIHQVLLPQTDILLASLHFHSQMAWDSEEQALQATIIRQQIASQEDLIGHQRTVVLGDFNMDPFDLGVIGAQALNAVMTRDLARLEGRVVSGRPYRYFYNPMWGCLGDRTPGPPGTYFYSSPGPRALYWHLFDQVLLRPSIMHSLNDLRIIHHDGTVPLVNDRGRPLAAEISDHLPLFVQLKL